MNITYVEWMQILRRRYDDGARAAEVSFYNPPYKDPGGDSRMIGENQAYRDGYLDRMIDLSD